MICSAIEAKTKGYLPGVGLDRVDMLPEQVDVPTGPCGCPDRPDADIADAKADHLSRLLGADEEFCSHMIDMHKRMLNATGRGSWPVGCHSAWPENHSCTVHWDWDTFPSQYQRLVTQADLNNSAFLNVWGLTLEQASDLWLGKPQIRVTWDLCKRTYKRVGIAMTETSDGPNGEHNIHVLAKPIAGSVIGYAYFNDATCGDHVTCNIDSTWNPGLHRCTLLLAHELGHNMNLDHEFSNQGHHRAIMSYEWMTPYVGFSTGSAPYDRPLDPSLSVLRRYFGDPIPQDEPDNPDPPQPPVGGVEFLDQIIKFKVGGRTISLRVDEANSII